MKKLIWLDPAQCLIVGVDVPADEMPELADPERLALPMDPGMPKDIQARGVETPVVVVQQGKKYYVRDGRRRVLACREIPDIKVPCVTVDTGTALDVASANAWRVEEPAWIRARRADRLKRMGYKADEICSAMGPCSKMQLTHYKHLLNVCPEIMARIEAGELTVTLGYELGRLAQADQPAALAKLTTTNGQAALDEVKAAGEESSAPPRRRKPAKPPAPSTRRGLPTVAQIQLADELLMPNEEEAYSSETMMGAHKMLLVLLGDETPEEAFPNEPDLRSVIKRCFPTV